MSELLKWSTENTPRGEFLIIVEGNPNDVEENNQDDFLKSMSTTEQVDYFISNGTKTNDAIKKLPNYMVLKNKKYIIFTIKFSIVKKVLN